MELSRSIFRLNGRVQHYPWGGHSFIPDLVGITPRPGNTYAEYWMGSHALAPSNVSLEDNERTTLDALITEYPREVLGEVVWNKYGRLPFLFKVLDVRDMLSIQVHPNKSQAEEGYARENESGASIDAPSRSYKDDNHKPEVMVALSEFWLLHGFKPEAATLDVLDQVPEFAPLRESFQAHSYLGLYEYIMNLPDESVAEILEPLTMRVNDKKESLPKTSPDYWLAKFVRNNQSSRNDRGLFSIYFLNLVHLEEGQSIFQDAGVPHAYLEGQNIELMANSDNVLRGGLTQKLVNVPELLRITRFDSITPTVVTERLSPYPFETCYDTPVQDFRLCKIELGQGDLYRAQSYSIEIILVLEGEVSVHGGQRLSCKRGESVVILSGTEYRIEALSSNVRIFKASVPVQI